MLKLAVRMTSFKSKDDPEFLSGLGVGSKLTDKNTDDLFSPQFWYLLHIICQKQRLRLACAKGQYHQKIAPD